jgi:signal transduction histidine kinase
VPLAAALDACREDVLHRWKDRVRGTLAPDSTPALELLDHIPAFLDEIIVALREDGGPSPTDLPAQESATAAEHGVQRLRLGFSLDSVVREYGALRDAIISSARDAGETITFRELQIVSDCVVTGIADAVTEYTLQRDAALIRQANEHFAFIAHELRNPLAAASMAFGLLEKRGDVSAQDRTAAAVGRGLSRAIDLIDKTLRSARVASGIALQRRWTTLRAVCEEAELDSIVEAEAKGVTLRLDVADERVELDDRLVRSALANLVRNGVKYSPSGRTVQLRARVASGRAVFEIADACGGLPPGRVEQAFAPFVRLDEGQTGFGLGLAISKQAADAHGGSLRVQNVPGEGCVFVLEIPLTVDSR